jgi:molybdopterin molybdotransferase
MTGAGLPEGADAVVMVEHTNFQSGREGDVVRLDRAVRSGQHVVRRGSEGAAGQVVIAAGMRMGFAEMAAAAQVGAANPVVVRKPRVAILTTGDEVVDFAATPGPFQIRNSNSVSLAAQVALCGAEAVILGNAGDSLEDIRAKILVGLTADMLILSGGVSMGKYDLVEPVLKEFGAEIVFDAVAIRPGKPVVFAVYQQLETRGKPEAQGKPFDPRGTPLVSQGKPVVFQDRPIFGLPGNPVSTMVTFELFVRPAIDLLCGELEARALPFTDAILTAAMSEKPGLTHFLPARMTWGTETPRVAAIAWQGSGDVGAMSRANCLLVVGAERERIEAGERVRVLPLGFC